MRTLAQILAAAAAATACSGTIGGDDVGDGDRDARPAPDDGGVAGDAPACPAGQSVGVLADAALPAIPANATAFLAAADGGVVAAWHAAGNVHVQAFELDGAAIGEAASVPAVALYGLASSGAAHGVLVSRGADELHLVVVGAADFDRRVLGGVPH